MSSQQHPHTLLIPTSSTPLIPLSRSFVLEPMTDIAITLLYEGKLEEGVVTRELWVLTHRLVSPTPTVQLSVREEYVTDGVVTFVEASVGAVYLHPSGLRGRGGLNRIDAHLVNPSRETIMGWLVVRCSECVTPRAGIRSYGPGFR